MVMFGGPDLHLKWARFHDSAVRQAWQLLAHHAIAMKDC
jgi:hypothetical protein